MPRSREQEQRLNRAPRLRARRRHSAVSAGRCPAVRTCFRVELGRVRAVSTSPCARASPLRSNARPAKKEHVSGLRAPAKGNGGNPRRPAIPAPLSQQDGHVTSAAQDSAPELRKSITTTVGSEPPSVAECRKAMRPQVRPRRQIADQELQQGSQGRWATIRREPAATSKRTSPLRGFAAAPRGERPATLSGKKMPNAGASLPTSATIGSHPGASSQDRESRGVGDSDPTE